MGKFNNFRNSLDHELKENRKSFLVFMILRALIIVVLVRSIFRGDFESTYLCVITLLMLLIPSIIKATFKVELPQTLEIIIYCFIFAAEILGEINSFYTIIPMWDTILHTLNGFLAAAIGYSMVTLMNNEDNLTFHLSPLYLCLVAFCFSMTIGVLWEFGEFGMDYYFGFDAQKDTVVTAINSVYLNPNGLNDIVRIKDINSVIVNGVDLGVNGYLDIGLIDTIKDMFVNFIGALVFSVFGYYYAKLDKNQAVMDNFLVSKKKNA